MKVKDFKEVVNQLPDDMEVRVCRPKTEKTWTSYPVDCITRGGGEMKLWIKCSTIEGHRLLKAFLKKAES